MKANRWIRRADWPTTAGERPKQIAVVHRTGLSMPRVRRCVYTASEIGMGDIIWLGDVRGDPRQ